jgi:NNP family nitrate/nitrite transporter-like MFS transporter
VSTSVFPVLIGQDLHLNAAQKGLMVATPSLAGAFLRVVNGVFVDRFGPKKTGIVSQLIVIGGMFAAWRLGVHSFGQILMLATVLGVAGASFAAAGAASLARAAAAAAAAASRASLAAAACSVRALMSACRWASAASARSCTTFWRWSARAMQERDVSGGREK